MGRKKKDRRGVKAGTIRGSYQRISDTSNYAGRQARVVLTDEQRAQVEQFRARLESDPAIEQIAESTVNTYCRYAGYIFAGAWTLTKSNRNQLKSVILYLEEYDLLPESFVKPESLFAANGRRKGSKKAVAMTDDKLITVSEYHQLLNVLPTDERGHELRRLCRVAFYFGLRLNEALSVVPGRFHAKGNDVFLFLPASDTKGAKERDAECLTNFDALLEPFDITTIQGFTISESYVKYQMGKARKTLKTSKKLTFHTLRHSYASHAIDKHADIRRVSKSLGHHSIDFTERVYVHQSASSRNFI